MAKSNQGAARLLQAMKKLVREVNDQEICRRLEILINSEKEDLPQQLGKKIFESPWEIEPRDIQEPYTQYVMHYLFMLKREEREAEKRTELGVPASRSRSGSSRRTPAAKKNTKKSVKKSTPAKKKTAKKKKSG